MIFIFSLFSEVMQKIVENCQDQNGSRLIQQHFESTTLEEREQIFEKILPEALRLIQDVFGNYVIQKILEKGTYEQKVTLFEVFEGKVYMLSIHTYGCRVIQKALEVDFRFFLLLLLKFVLRRSLRMMERFTRR